MDRRTELPIRTLTGHPSYIYSLAITRDGKYGISAHDDHRLRVWDLEKTELNDLRLRQRPLLLTLLPKGHVASTCADRALRIWRKGRVGPVRSLRPAPEPVISLRSSLSGLSLVTITWTLRLRITERFLGLPLPDPRSLWTFLMARYHRPQIRDGRYASIAATSPSLTTIVFSCSDPFWARLNLWTDSISISKGRHRSTITAIAVSASGRYVVSGSEDGVIKLWRSQTRTELLTLEGHSGGVSGVAVGGGHIISTGFADNTLKVWDAGTGKEISRFTADFALQACCLGIFGRVIAASDISGRIHYLRMQAGG